MLNIMELNKKVVFMHKGYLFDKYMFGHFVEYCRTMEKQIYRLNENFCLGGCMNNIL